MLSIWAEWIDPTKILDAIKGWIKMSINLFANSCDILEHRIMEECKDWDNIVIECLLVNR